MFKLFKSKKKSKKEKESKKDQNKENIENKSIISNDKKQNEVDDKKSKKQEEQQQQHHLSVDTSTQTNNGNNNNNTFNSCQVSPSVLSDSHHESTFQSTHHHDNNLNDHQHHSFKASELNALNASFSGADLNRILTSGYITGDEDMGYLKHGVEPKTPKSPHFHRPPNFSYTHNSNVSSHRKTNQGLLTSTLSSITTVKKIRHYSTSPTRSIESEEAIRLSRLPGGYVPDPEVPKKIESLDWPSPPYPAAVPELRSRSRSTSNRRADLSQKDQVDHSFKHSTIDNEIKTSTKVYRKIYDNQHDDYLLRFKRNKNEEIGDDDDTDEQVVVDEKLKRDLEEISKLENKSGLAKIIAKELKAQEKVIAKPLDPWKASRTPNASLEPYQKTRFESPVNASPSRVICSYKSSNVSQNLYEDGICSTSAISSSTIHKDSVTPTNLLCSTPRKGNTLQKSTVPKPGYGLSSPRATTLPNSARYTALSTHKSVDFESFGASNSYYVGQNNANNTDDKIKLDSLNAYYNSRNAHATRSTPNLIGTPKIYKYDELKTGYKKKLPTDIDRERLERHLASDELMRLFGVSTLEEFYELPEWKRTELKKKAKLF